MIIFMKTPTKGLNLHTPSPFIYFMGFIDGRTKTAAIDNNTLRSAFIDSRLNMFQAYCENRIKRLERDLSAVYAEASLLLMEFNTLSQKETVLTSTDINTIDAISLPTTFEEAQRIRSATKKAQAERNATEYAASRKEKRTSRKVEILKRLVEISGRISTEERACYSDLYLTSFKLRAVFNVYSKAVVLKPISDTCIPIIDVEHSFDRYNTFHESLKMRLIEVTDLLTRKENSNV